MLDWQGLIIQAVTWDLKWAIHNLEEDSAIHQGQVHQMELRTVSPNLVFSLEELSAKPHLAALELV